MRLRLIAAWILALIGNGQAAPVPAGWGLNGPTPGMWADGNAAKHQWHLRQGKITYLREDIRLNAADWPKQKENLQKLRTAGFKIVGLIPYGIGRKPMTEGDALYEDLGEVYAAAQKWEAEAGDVVDVWENYNEPDLGFCRDTPDRFSAYAKAVYLGLKAGSHGRKPVLLPSLGTSPGPWAERVAANGLFTYGDAFNFHYYGTAADFPWAVRVVRDFEDEATKRDEMAAVLPLWLTEIGDNNLPSDDFANGRAREQQAGFFGQTMRSAVEAKLASFMPYAYFDGSAYSLTDGTGYGYRALTDYEDFTRTHALGGSPASINQEANAAPVILQWLPDANEAVPHKVSGTWRFPAGQKVMRGVVRAYNFSTQPARGTLNLSGLSQITAGDWKDSGVERIELPAMGRREWRVAFSAPADGYCCERARFVWKNPATGRISPLEFGLETTPQGIDFLAWGIEAARPGRKGIAYGFAAIAEDSKVTSESGPWIGVNGVKVDAGKNSDETSGDLAVPSAFSITQKARLLWLAPTAVTTVKGLPAEGFLRLRADRILGRDLLVWVDLIDDRGQRFCVHEYGGMSYVRESHEVWLNWHDFHRYGWGHFAPGHAFDPKAVREIQLRFFTRKLNDPVKLSLQTMGPLLKEFR